MVTMYICDYCGAETRHVVTKVFNGKPRNFCCRGCLAVYEIQNEEMQLQHSQTAPVEENPISASTTTRKISPFVF
jgi:Putative metal-binding domain of cation transport ATPase